MCSCCPGWVEGTTLYGIIITIFIVVVSTCLEAVLFFIGGLVRHFSRAGGIFFIRERAISYDRMAMEKLFLFM